MEKPPIPRPAVAGSVTTTLLVLASVGLNVFLAAQLLRHKPSLPAPPAAAGGKPVERVSQPASTATPADTSLDSETTNVLGFHWSEVESADYRQYIANLRAVGCPEQIIRDIIVADVNQLFAPRAAAIWKPRVSEYWQKPRNEQANPDQRKQLMALSKDKAAVFQELLGFRPSEQALINTVFLQLYGNEQNLLFLPADKQETALRVLTDAEFEVKEEELHNRRGYSRGADQELFDEKLKVLAKVLSPAELEEFRMRGSPAADWLRIEVEYFNCTPDEFKLLLDAREQNPERKYASLDLLNRAAATEEARKLFGEERAKEFERVTDMFYVNARRAAEEHGVALERVDEAWQVTRDTRTAAESLAKNANLSPEDRKGQVQALQQQAEARLNELLGRKAALGVIRDLRGMLLNPKPSP